MHFKFLHFGSQEENSDWDMIKRMEKSLPNDEKDIKSLKHQRNFG